MFEATITLLTVILLFWFSSIFNYPRNKGFFTAFCMLIKVTTQVLGVYYFFVFLKNLGVI